MRVVQLGEFGLIDRETAPLRQCIGSGGKNSSRLSKEIIAGIGDDAAVIKWKQGKYLLITTDTLIEKVHFRREYFSFYQIGWKALASNLSDNAAMGGIPKYILISLGLPPDESVENVDALYKGVYDLGKKFKTALIGGDTVSSPKGIVVTIVLLGEVEEKNLVLREGAKPGDKIFVTGTLGDSAAGLEILKRGQRAEGREQKKLIKKHLIPEPRVKEARLIAAHQLATSMIDISDGLDLSIKFICQASGVGAKIYLEKIPHSSGVSLQKALYGGEDYELLFTSPANKSERVKRIKAVTPIGEITNQKEKIEYINSRGKIIKIKGKGYQHF